MNFGGMLASHSLVGRTDTLLYEVTGRLGFNATVHFCNQNDFDVKIRLALVDGNLTDFVSGDYNLKYDAVLRANGTLEKTDIKIKKDQSLIGYSNCGNVAATVWA